MVGCRELVVGQDKGLQGFLQDCRQAMMLGSVYEWPAVARPSSICDLCWLAGCTQPMAAAQGGELKQMEYACVDACIHAGKPCESAQQHKL